MHVITWHDCILHWVCMVFITSQWETLQCNIISHWFGAVTKWSQGIDSVLVIEYIAMRNWKYWWLCARLWYLQCTGNGSICSLVLSNQYICYNKNYIWFTYLLTKVLFAMVSKGECLLLWKRQDQLGGQWSGDQNIWEIYNTAAEKHLYTSTQPSIWF